jgi:hypothetical protein
MYHGAIESQTHMALADPFESPRASQQPQTFHPDFERDVFMIVLSVCATSNYWITII